jgi:hypothetical protein
LAPILHKTQKKETKSLTLKRNKYEINRLSQHYCLALFWYHLSFFTHVNISESEENLDQYLLMSMKEAWNYSENNF